MWTGILTLALCLGTQETTRDITKVINRRLEPKQTVLHLLHQVGLSNAHVNELEGALSAAGFDFRKARAGDQIRLVFKNEKLELLDYRRSPLIEWQIRREENHYSGKMLEADSQQVVEVVELSVDSSLWNAAIAAGERPEIAVVLADVFAWDIDFYRDVQKGDNIRAIVEKVVSKGRTLAYGNILAAQYRGSSVGLKRSYRYRLPDKSETYFMEDGSSARKTFLKSPLKFSRITSRFGMRMHPVLKYERAHKGVDYSADIGTPVWAVADGVVSDSSYGNAGGNSVCIRHAVGFETCYRHLSKRHVAKGQRVSQKQLIGLSGNTGMSTGPHLHFELLRKGVHVNPLNQNFPRAEPVPHTLLADFKEKILPLRAALESPSKTLSVAQYNTPTTSTSSPLP
ncbi:MAG: M23 family metallopeptidase [Cystobacterineae bacterium]|nr:M23 family metallopeptidase [Cystobacterineae bacterium]MCL2259327.1 M23 family metallopeptidase [Cystobacterineae bacterium]